MDGADLFCWLFLSRYRQEYSVMLRDAGALTALSYNRRQTVIFFTHVAADVPDIVILELGLPIGAGKDVIKLFFLTGYAGKVITHRRIPRGRVGTTDTEDTQYLRVYVGHPRQKPDDPMLIVTALGIGYRTAERLSFRQN